MEEEKIIIVPHIIIKELNREASPEETKILHEWLSLSPDNRLLYEQIRQKQHLASIIKSYDSIDELSAWEAINQAVYGRGRAFRRVVLSALKYAALIAIPILIAAYLLVQKTPTLDSFSTFHSLQELMKELNETSLIMASGEIINLAVSADSIISIDGTQVSKVGSEISYRSGRSVIDSKVKYNTLVSPRGRVFNVVLSDGTTVWLNASSAIRYPIHFEPHVRKVYLSGEAFFEVAEDAERPFIVLAKNMNVEVTGTSFNLMAYPDDITVEATLVQGQVTIKTSKHELVLEPGNQARLDVESGQLQELEVNTDMFTSWKDGKYVFERANLEAVMTKLSRWYNFDIVYESDNVRDLHFSGTLYKYYDITKTLKIIELATTLKFETKDNTVYVNNL